MVAIELKQRINLFAIEAQKLEAEREMLVADLAQAITDQLLELYERHNPTVWRQPPTFEQWLGSCFDYDIFTVFDIFVTDPVLAGLKASIDEVDVNGSSRRDTAKAVNTRLKAAGYKLGVNEDLVNTRKI